MHYAKPAFEILIYISYLKIRDCKERKNLFSVSPWKYLPGKKSPIRTASTEKYFNKFTQSVCFYGLSASPRRFFFGLKATEDYLPIVQFLSGVPLFFSTSEDYRRLYTVALIFIGIETIKPENGATTRFSSCEIAFKKITHLVLCVYLLSSI